MLNLNLIFHLASVVALFGVLYWLCLLQSQRGFLRSLLNSNQQQGIPLIRVDWPLVFFSKMAMALDVPFEAKVPLKSVLSCKIMWSAVSEAIGHSQFQKISCHKNPQTNKAILSVELYNKDKVEPVLACLSRAIGSKDLSIEVI